MPSQPRVIINHLCCFQLLSFGEFYYSGIDIGETMKKRDTIQVNEPGVTGHGDRLAK